MFGRDLLTRTIFVIQSEAKDLVCIKWVYLTKKKRRFKRNSYLRTIKTKKNYDYQ